jgi:Ca-activated chloride channel homolog
MKFVEPAYLIFVLAALLVFVPRWRGNKRVLSIGYSNIELLRGAAHPWDYISRLGPMMLRFLVLGALVLALARPQLFEDQAKKTVDGIDMMLAIDTSGSMRALDLEWQGERMNRLSVVKRVLNDFYEQRPNDRMGVVVFGTEAFMQVPLTLDQKILKTLTERLSIGMAGDATAIGDAVAMATKGLKEIEADTRVIILLTDGSNTAGSIDPPQAAEIAKSLGVKVYTIAVGSEGRAPMPVKGFFGESVQYVPVELDEKLLKSIAETTGGQYFRAKTTEDLKEVYTTIDQLEKREIKGEQTIEGQDVFKWFVMIAGIFMACELLFNSSKMRALPV